MPRSGIAATMLLAEDDADDREWITAELKKNPIVRSVTSVSDGEELVSYLRALASVPRERLPDLILLDLLMPLKNGLEALESIRSDTELRRIPIIVFTV